MSWLDLLSAWNHAEDMVAINFYLPIS